MSTQKMVRELEAEGFIVVKTGGSHFRITHPDMDGPVFAGSSPSCVRAKRNMMSLIKRKMRHATHAD